MKAHIALHAKSGTYYLRYWEPGVQRIHKNRKQKKLGTLLDWPTREAAAKANAGVLNLYNRPSTPVPKVKELVQQFREERMSKRYSTQYACNNRLENHILPAWGDSLITDLKARPVELWLRGLNLAPKTLVHLRSLIAQLWDFAMWLEVVPEQRNPMGLVTIKSATLRKKPRSLTEDEFRKFAAHLEEPYRAIALLCVTFGLRISEALALKWSDVDWLKATLAINRGIVRQHLDEVKTSESRRAMSIDVALLEVLKAWKATTSFGGSEDWIFASPVKYGKLPLSYTGLTRCFQEAARNAGIQAFGTHSLRHTYRSWLDAAGTSIAVQQKLMRHADIRTTMNIYGDVVTDEMRQAHAKVVRMALES
jgi:integrase